MTDSWQAPEARVQAPRRIQVSRRAFSPAVSCWNHVAERWAMISVSPGVTEYQTQRFLPIIRTDAGSFFGFGEYDGPQGNSFAGRFAELMPPHPTSADQRALARQLLDAMGLTEAVLSGTPFNN